MEDYFEQRAHMIEQKQKRIFSYLMKTFSEIKKDYYDDKIICERDLILSLYYHLRKMFEANRENYQIHSEVKLHYSSVNNCKIDIKYIDLVIEGFDNGSLVILYIVECKYFTKRNPFNSARWSNDFLKWQKIALIQNSICPRFIHFILYDYTPMNSSPLTEIFSSKPQYEDTFKSLPDISSTSSEITSQILTEWIRTHYIEFIGVRDDSWKIFHNFSFVYGAIERNLNPIEKDEINI